MKNIFSATVFLTLTGVNYIFGQGIPRYDSACGLLSNKIYCFGGKITKDGNLDNSINVLDIVAYSGSTADELKNKWQNISSNMNGNNIQFTSHSQNVVLPDGKSMLLSGGEGFIDNSSAPITRVYDSESNSWSIYPEYTDPDSGRRRIIYRAASVLVPYQGIGFIGGYEVLVNSSQTLSKAAESNNVMHMGYDSLTFLNLNKSADLSWFVYEPQYHLTKKIRGDKTSIFDIKSNRIFFFGGKYYNKGSETQYTLRDFKDIEVFDMANNNWTTQVTYGNVKPNPRLGHTTTIVGPEQRDVLLFGGACETPEYDSCSDYAFNFNLDTFGWKLHDHLRLNPIMFPKRYSHSAIAVNDNTVFIVFGLTSPYEITDTILILNTTTPSQLTLMENYTDVNNVNVSSKKPSTVAIIGISIGSIVGIFIILGMIVLWYRKKKKIDEKKRQLEIEEHERQQRIDDPANEVDWDDLDKRYFEMSSTIYHKKSYSPLLASEATTSLTAILSQRPDAVDKNDITTSSNYTVQKPDGGA
ncbi:uncharacterized protein EV154DRAFT_561240 [Mucor mucedo]|uniref:uncharacterized protein n=1 Tax=Mucor mucedo TaxID=29922 RepID=UPI00221FE01F|nr:uncharacterized protein EV154DRAFT_561240 [Mucor mucedo]KAI7893495.1 hypothetical protein EV154DRAFT_561240 [Mucor mucedo]